MKTLKFYLIGIIILISVSCKKEKKDKEDVFIPLPVDLISPENGAGNQPLNVTLIWKNINEEIYKYTYDLYMGLSETDLKKVDSNLVNESWSYESYECNFLELKTKYYWKVVAKIDGKESTDNELCVFTTTGELPTVQFQDSTLVIYPYNYVYEYQDTIKYIIRSSTSGAYSKTDGKSNTEKLVNDFDKYGEDGFYIAAKQCYDLDAFGYDDWYLPAINELDSICKNSNTLSDQTLYWSSTESEVTDLNAYIIHTGQCDITDDNKFKQYTFRCVRKEK